MNGANSTDVLYDQHLTAVQLARFCESCEHLYTAAVGKRIHVIDFECDNLYSAIEYEDIVQSFSWTRDESLIVTNTKNNRMQISDIRTSKTEISVNSHQNMRDARVVWLSDENYIISSGLY